MVMLAVMMLVMLMMMVVVMLVVMMLMVMFEVHCFWDNSVLLKGKKDQLDCVNELFAQLKISTFTFMLR